MNISQLFKNFGNSSLQQLSGNQKQTQSQSVNQQQNAQQQVQAPNQNQDQYIHQEEATQKSAGIYSPEGMTQQLPQSASGEFVEKDSEAVSFNPYTFNPEAMNESRTSEPIAASDRTEGMTENGALSEEMPDLPPIPEGEESNSGVSSELPEQDESASTFSAKIDSESNDGSKSSNMAIKASDSKQSEGAGKSGGAAPVSSDDDDDSDDEEKLRELEQERAQLRQRLNSEQDNNIKAGIRVELRSVENQISQIKAQMN